MAYPISPEKVDYIIRNVSMTDIKEVYRLLVSNRPYVGLNSRYTYYLLARDFYDTCVVAEKDGKIIGFSSGYIPPNRPDTLFNWEIVVDQEHRGNGLQRRMLLYQIKAKNVRYLEATINPSNDTCKNNMTSLAQLLHTDCVSQVLFNEEDFENDGHETEILYRVGPILWEQIENVSDSDF